MVPSNSWSTNWSIYSAILRSTVWRSASMAARSRVEQWVEISASLAVLSSASSRDRRLPDSCSRSSRCNHHVRITADGRSKVGIVGSSQAKVPNVFRLAHGLFRPESYRRNQPFFRFACHLSKALAKVLGLISSRQFSGDPKDAHQLGQVRNLVPVRHIVHPVDKRLFLLVIWAATVSLAASMNFLNHHFPQWSGSAV